MSTPASSSSRSSAEIASIRVSRSVRSRMICCAFSGSSQSELDSASPFSSARRFCALSQSKMPPQQPDGLLGGFELVLGLGTHEEGLENDAPADGKRWSERDSEASRDCKPAHSHLET